MCVKRDDDSDITSWSVYCCFKAAQNEYLDRACRLPKNWEQYLETKMSKQNRDALERSVKYFRTVWSNIDPKRFMKYGFELYGKGFTYSKFFNRELLNFYKERDKNHKRNSVLQKKEIIKSFKFIKDFMSDKQDNSKVSTILRYCLLQCGYEPVIINHYVLGHIDNFTFVWMMYRGYFRLPEENRDQVPYITTNYRTIVSGIREVESFMIKAERMLL